MPYFSCLPTIYKAKAFLSGLPTAWKGLILIPLCSDDRNRSNFPPDEGLGSAPTLRVGGTVAAQSAGLAPV